MKICIFENLIENFINIINYKKPPDEITVKDRLNASKVLKLIIL